MANRSERQLHESVQKALMKHFPHVKETTAQQLEAIKALLFFYIKRTLLLCYRLGMGNPLQSFKLALMKLQVKELQTADVKHVFSITNLKMRSSSWKASTVLYMGHLKLHEVDVSKTTN